MSPARSSVSVVGWILTVTLLIGVAVAWNSRQQVVDALNYYQFQPSSEVAAMASQAGMTDKATFMFYTSRPELQESEAFNERCERKEANSPILGCYSGSRIYIYDVTDERLDGLETVTAAHEMLHAAWERLSPGEQAKLSTQLETAYKRVETSALAERMAYYEKTEPGQRANELHSILGTEFDDIGTDLETYYETHFEDRAALVDLHQNVESVFTSLKNEADALVQRIETLVASINAQTAGYNQATANLNQAVSNFNQRAGQPGGFSSQQEFNQARNELEQERLRLANVKAAIERDITTYKSLLSQLDAINAEAAELNGSLDSTLSDVPTV